MSLMTIVMLVTAPSMVTAVFRCEEVGRQSLLDFYLIRTCSRSTMKVTARANLQTPDQCALFALRKRGLAFNFSPPGLMQSRHTCVVCECPELENLASLKKDLRYDYYSLYGNPLPSINHTCIPKVGVFLLHPERRNFSEALNSCRTSNSELAHVVSEVRTTALSELIKKLGENRGPKRAYVSLEDRKVEGRFITTMGEPLNCFDYVAWAPSEPRNRLPDEDCVVLDRNQQWGVTRCSTKMPYVCELWPGGEQAADTATTITRCTALQNADEIKSCFEEGTPANITNKFQRCWRGIQAKYNNTLPPLIEWNVTLANRKQHETSSQNDTARNVPSTNDTQQGTSPPNKSEQAKARKSVTKNAPQQNSVTGQKT